jgi:hypothetical protein
MEFFVGHCALLPDTGFLRTFNFQGNLLTIVTILQVRAAIGAPSTAR